MTKENTIKINRKDQELWCRTIDPTDGFKIEKDGTLTLYIFRSYKSGSHDTRADVDVIENDGNILLVKVESIDWHKNRQYPYTTQGCFLFQQTIEKRGRKHISVDRVPCSKNTIADAIEFLMPSEVKKAVEEGRRVIRQGDFFFVQMKKSSNLSALSGSRHNPVGTKTGISIQHPEHTAVKLGKGHWKAVQRKTMNHVKAD